MISGITLRNFRCFDHLEVSFLNKQGSVKNNILLMGDNASGKTSFIYSLSFLSALSNTLVNFKKDPHQFDPLIKISNKHKRWNSTENMSIVYKISLDGDKYEYKVEFDLMGNLHYEHLLKKRQSDWNTIFKMADGQYSLGYGIVKQVDLPYFESLFSVYSKEHSVLAMLKYGHKSLKFSLKKSVVEIIETTDHIFFSHKTDICDINPKSGYCNKVQKNRLIQSEILLSEYMKYHFKKIDHIYYKFSQVADDQYSYSCVVVEDTALGMQEVNLEDCPLGFHKVLDSSTIIINVNKLQTVILDDLDSALNVEALSKILDSIESLNIGQVIVTVSTLDILNRVDPRSVFISYYEDNQHRMLSIEDHENFRSDHNIRNQFEKGKYIKRNSISPPNFKQLFEEHHAKIKKIKD